VLTLKIENPDIENIFLEGFDSNKDAFFEFIQVNYQKMLLLKSLERSAKQAKLQENGELDELSLDELINDIKNNPNT